MNSELKAFIYEAYNRGDIDMEDVENIIDDVDDCDITEAAYLAADAEITEAENIFIETAMNYAAGNVDVAVFEKKAEGIGAKVKAAWEKFKKWVKNLFIKITSSFKGVNDGKGKTVQVDKKQWTWLQKVDAAITKAYNKFTPIAAKMSNAEIDKNIGSRDVDIKDCFADLITLTTTAAIPAAAIAGAGVVWYKVNVTAINTLILSIGSISDKIILATDDSSSVVIKNIMKIFRPILNKIRERTSDLRRALKTVDDYRDNVRYLKKEARKRDSQIRDAAASKALKDHDYTDDETSRKNLKINSIIN